MYHAIVEDVRHEMSKPDMKPFSVDHVVFVPVVRSIDRQFGMQKTAVLGKMLREQMENVSAKDDKMREALDTVKEIIHGSIKGAEQGMGEFLREQLNDHSIKLNLGGIEIDPVDGVKMSPTLSDEKFENIPLANKGAGTQNNAILALFRYIAKLDVKKEFIFLLEEPENSLHPKAQHNLLSVIQEISDEAQVLVTTHSPVFVDRTNYESNILFTMKKHGGTVAKTFSEDNLSEVREELGIKVSDVLLKGGGNCALLVEGETEEDVIPVFMEMMDTNNFALGTTIIQVGGYKPKRIETIVKLLGCYEIPCIAMLDKNSKEGEKALKDLLSKDELPNLKKMTCLEKGEIEDYYQRDIIVQVMRDAYNIKISESDVREGSSVEDLKTIFRREKRELQKRELKKGESKKSVSFVKTRFGRQCAHLMRKQKVDVPKEIREVIDEVVKVALRT